MPLVTQTFSDIINFTRASSATYFDATGTLQTATTDVPRFDYNPSTLAAQGLLIEEARTNLLTYSEEFDNLSVWITNGGSTVVTADTEVAPDGTTTADTVLAAASTTTHLIQQSSISVANNTQYTFSVFVKDAGESVLWMRIGAALTPFGVSTGAFASFDLTAVTATPSTYGTTASITPVGNGWYRCSATTIATIAAGTSSFQITLRQPSSWTGTGTTGLYMWGAQLEAGAFPTSYIPTVASTVTRAADLASVNTLSPWFNISEGAFYTEWIVPSVTVDQNIASLSDTTSSNRYQNYTTVSSNVIVRTAASGVALNNQFGTPVKDAIGKSAFAYGAGSTAGSFNGGSVNTTTQTLPASITRLYLGASSTGATGKAVWLRRFTFYPRKFANAELQAITS